MFTTLQRAAVLSLMAAQLKRGPEDTGQESDGKQAEEIMTLSLRNRC